MPRLSLGARVAWAQADAKGGAHAGAEFDRVLNPARQLLLCQCLDAG